TKVRLTTSSQLSNTANGYQVTVTSGMVSAVTGGLTCNSPNNTSNFTGDTMPEVQSVATLTATQVDIIFSEYVLMDVSASGALNAANYTISPTLGTLSVTQLSNTKVRLTSTTGQTASVLYTVTVNNVTDITAPAGNVISPTAKTGTFIGQENLKILSGTKVAGVSTAFEVFSVTFSKPLIFGGGANAVDNMANWTFPSGMNTVTLCTPSDDAVCSPNNTINYVTGSDSVVYFKASPIPAGGAYTVVGASSGNCIKPSTDPGCLQANPNDRASIDFNLPLTISSGPVYTDPFNDAVTLSGQVLVYNGKLLVGPNNTDSGLFETNINMTNATSITLDSDSVAAGFQPFRGNATTNPPPLLGIFEDCAAGNCSTGNNYLAGIDYLYGACYTSGSPFVDSSLTGVACVNAGGTEYLFVLGYNTTATTTGYQSNWNTTNKVSPFIFTHVTGLSNAASRTYRAMNARVFKGWVYQASQHQAGTMAVRWNRFTPDGLTRVDLAGNFLNRIGEGGSINNGQQPAANGLISIDSMYEYDNDGSGGTNFSALYIANGGSCSVNGAADTTCLSGATRTAATFSDGGVLRTTQAYSDITPPPACTSAANCDTKFEDVTPTSGKWLSFMSIPLPDNAAPGGDWDQLQPINTIRPAIKAVPKMRTFNGDLYMIRNACASNTPYTVALGNFVSNGRKTCAAGSEVPQLWRLPKFTGTCSTSSLSGTISMTSGSAFVWGSGTSFGTELVAGDSIISNGSTQTIALIGGGTLSGAVMKRTGSTLLTGVGTNFPLEVATGSTITVGGVARTVATMGSGTLVGTVSVTAGSNTVVGGTGGAATRFQDQAIVGTSITIGGTTRTIAGITSATAMTITGTWPATLSAQTASVSGSAYLTMTATWTANSNSPGVTATVADNNLLTTTTTWPSTGAGKIFTLAVPKLNSLYTDQTACQSISGTWTAGTNGSYGGSAWKLVAEYGSTGKTIMAGASWSGGSNQTNLTLTNTEITLLVANGNRLYIGFDNASYGANIWRTKDKTLFANYSTLGVNAYPALESDFEAVCAAGNACTDPSMEFGFGSGASVNRIFDGITANDAGTDYVVVNAGDGINPLKIYRNTNN
ncbi:MAG: hypothetical protein OEV66_07765, partial [Spirochaetia bacterium]|nr:hypothetical protein [Spirochaetia bacterium]